jgi:hypothetical protein
MARIEQRKIANIDRGLFLIRYAAAEDDERPPKVRVAVDPSEEKDILLVLHPDHADATLSQPGSCLVVSARRPGKLIVEVAPWRRDGSTAATVKIEPLIQGAAEPSRSVEPTFTGSSIRVLGHVAGIGDVFAGAQEWLAGPSAPSRIEGIAIEWPDKPKDLALRYAVKTAKPQAASGRMMDLGTYAGTRGRALPVVSVVLELSGPRASRYEIGAEAIFLGSPQVRATGQRIVLTGPTGREPLVGFRLDMRERRTPAATPRRDAPSGRVKVFRSRTNPTQAALSQAEPDGLFTLIAT